MAVPASSCPWSMANFIFVLGGPGAGKGTQCRKLAIDFNVVHLSVGDLLRNQKDPAVSSLLQNTMGGGEIMPCEIVVKTLIDEIEENLKTGKKTFLIDGFPRTSEQHSTFEKFGRPICTLYFQCAENVMLERVLKRQKLSHRIDDNEETFHKRIKGHNSQIEEILANLRHNCRVVEIDCNGDLNEGYELVRNAFLQAVTDPGLS